MKIGQVSGGELVCAVSLWDRSRSRQDNTGIIL